MARQPALIIPVQAAAPSTGQQIIDFINGMSDGAALMAALYDAVLDEAVPPRLSDLVRRRQPA